MRLITLFLILFLFCHPISAGPIKITFPNACIKGNSIIIAAVGDVLLHQPLQMKALKQGFESLWEEALPFIKSADIAYANLEGPMAFGINRLGQEINQNHSRSNNNIYTGFPMFNYHPSLAGALKDSGFDIVSTANNHGLDRYSIGIDKTITALNKAGVAYVGTRPRGSQQSWISIIHKRGFKIAWISCTEMTNGFNDKYKQVLYCYKKNDRQWIIRSIRELKSQVDAIIISPHWGEEYQRYPNAEQKQFARQVLDEGATAVIGSHPHVLQPLQKYVTKDGRPTIIMYSLGNFVSYQGKPNTRNTVILFLGLTQTSNGTIINNVSFVPMYMQNRSGWQEMQLTRVPSITSTQSQVISQVMPMGNAIFSPSAITNPSCNE